MPKRKDINKVMIIGAGPIIIGQAAEFDYSGSQACRSLRDEGCQVILLNSNPATIQTDLEMADRIYIEPLTVETIEKIITKEKPDGILAGMGGQTALNLCSELSEKGIETGIHYKPIHTFSFYKSKIKLPITEKVGREIVTLPTHPNLTQNDVEKIIKEINYLS